VARALDARRSRLLLAALVVTHLVVISQQVDSGGGVSLLERGVFALFSPLQIAVASALRGIGAAWTGYVDLRGVRADNALLERRLADALAQLEQERQRSEETPRLRELLDLRAALPLDTVAAEVVAREGLPWFHTLTLNKGRDAGIALNAAVLSPTGVMGRVVALGPRAARVQLLLDRDSGVGALVERTRATGIVSGHAGLGDEGKTDLVMKYVSSLADVVAGDRVLTSGVDGIYPKGLVIGRVRLVGAPAGLFKEVAVTPSARFDSIETVLVVRGAPEAPAITESVR
jgi:rod shape-determining protein MreC